MSYVVSIVREASIDRAELESIAGESADFELEEIDDVCLLHWSDGRNTGRETFVLSGNSLDITSPSDAALVAAQELAARLDARVVGEEGEDLSGVEPMGTEAGSVGCGPLFGSILLIAALLAAYWLFS